MQREVKARPPAPLRPLGALEERVREILWSAGPLPVRDVATRLGGRLAYTTVMTTLDRLYKKGLAARAKDGSAFVYRAALERDAYHRRVVEETVAGLLARSSEPVLAGFIDAAAAVDEENLRRLERLIAARKRSGR
jgi:predicted transcriptional regulator